MNKENYNLQEYMEQNEYEKEMVVTVSTLQETIDTIHKELAAKATDAIINMMEYRGIRRISVYDIDETIHATEPILVQDGLTLQSVTYVKRNASSVRITADKDSEDGYAVKELSELSADCINQIVNLVKQIADDFDNELYTVDETGNLVPVEQ